ncbi:hypothetical protein FHG87_007863 [Trinorchestia longiramus]|nr:hypothetical protein FHG87_007863 [Trinorchestia longiramus]
MKLSTTSSCSFFSLCLPFRHILLTLGPASSTRCQEDVPAERDTEKDGEKDGEKETMRKKQRERDREKETERDGEKETEKKRRRKRDGERDGECWKNIERWRERDTDRNR